MLDKKKSFAQELADLFNPAPTKEYDPDELDLGDAAKLASDEEYGDARAAPSKRAPEKAMLLRGEIMLEDAAYRGRKTSRSAIFGDDGSNEDAEDGFLSSDGSEGLSDDDDDDGDDDDDNGDDDGDGLKRQPVAVWAGPSGQTTAAAVPTTGARKRGVAHANGVANSFHGGEGNHEEDAVDSDLTSGSGSELDEDAMEEDDDGEQEEEDAEANGHMLGQAAAADGKTKRVEQRLRVDGRVSHGDGDRGGDELEALEAEYEALQEEDEKQLETLRKKGERDREKGAAIRNQQVLYERALEQRILLQRCLQASNGLPRPDTFAALAIAKPDIREGYEQLAVAARDTLSQLLELQHTLMARNSAIRLPPGSSNADVSAASGAKRRRLEPDPSGDADNALIDNGLECLWRRISLHSEALAPFRDLSLDSWHRRTVLSSGSGPLRNSGLRALNQSISNQVQALMRDPAKFIKRTRLAVAACPRVLCEPPRSSAAAAAALDPLGSDGYAVAAGRDGAADPSSTVPELPEEERDPETYDDGEFYQQLLKEFLDKGISEGAATVAKGTKKRKLVDRRASKGRKLRYHVQEKLVAFMAPVDFPPPSFAANLFTNLFGHSGK
ncbi:hypothetical protein Vretimale_8087 [Volvox reticuliferus]|uniref:Apoptosis antagonizing transcription factor n=1 Tax=Volvox reticuliferus TaxID=1737510 RepID=A0A8J4LNB5_9CHLO|nr:hypothetical protein Vretifemale_5239 [Volvox reticuliferus]GIM03341.1 hypothetical protein Vretimale_8087 [Volvox reticuliferus]